jgi:hypothetical protein
MLPTWIVGVILQRLPKLPDRSPDAVVCIEKDTLTPNPRDDFVPGDNLVLLLNKQDKNLQRDALQFEDVTAAGQPPGTGSSSSFAEPDRSLLSDLG